MGADYYVVVHSGRTYRVCCPAKMVTQRAGVDLCRFMCRLGRFMCRFKAADVSIGIEQVLQIVRPTSDLRRFLP